MKIELVPEPDADDPASLAAAVAIEQTGLASEARQPANASAWWRAGVREAVEAGVASRGHATAVRRRQRRTAP